MRGFLVGSSPHTRGARAARWMAATWTGIIPAYAGSTTQQQTVRLDIPDHPRIRGEHWASTCTRRRRRGSSPHTRGAPQHRLDLAVPVGIIPAYAGSTGRGRRRRHRLADHPRIRGEHRNTRSRAPAKPGSSPHTRGALAATWRGRNHDGIIPAYAGSTVSPACIPATVRDHPRIRGEHCQRSRLAPPIWGSSPHTRGARTTLSRGCP